VTLLGNDDLASEIKSCIIHVYGNRIIIQSFEVLLKENESAVYFENEMFKAIPVGWNCPFFSLAFVT
jgi:hypothetical protein